MGVATAGLAGCGDETSSTGGGDCLDYSTFAGSTPTVAFANDVLPIFRTSCGLSVSCHGSQSGPAEQPYLGPSMADPAPSAADIQAIFDANVNVDALKAPTMKIIKPSDAANSFLMHKVDNSLSCPEVKCGTAGCGTSMPQGSGTLPEDKRDTIRRWILQGAKND